MTRRLRYHVSVRRSIPASIALFAVIAILGQFASRAQAQITQSSSPAASSVSTGTGGHAAGAAMVHSSPGVVVIPRTGPVVPPTGTVPFASVPHHNPVHVHHRRQDSAPALGVYPYAYAVPVPYQGDDTQNGQDAEDDNDPDYQGGPTVFDRRGSGADSYVPPVNDVPKPHATENADADPPAPEAPPQPTMLVFKDGQKLQVENYAIVGATLYDLTPGRHRKIMLADLDLDATEKLNDEQGVSFQLPPSPQAN
jgi:hypothetical protein